jgi:hypothetical protein
MTDIRARLTNPSTAVVVFREAAQLMTHAVGVMHDELEEDPPKSPVDQLNTFAAFAVALSEHRDHELRLDAQEWEMLLLACLTLTLAAYHELSCVDGKEAKA